MSQQQDLSASTNTQINIDVNSCSPYHKGYEYLEYALALTLSEPKDKGQILRLTDLATIFGVTLPPASKALTILQKEKRLKLKKGFHQ